MVIECDDYTHDKKKDKDEERDILLRSAGYETLRFDCRDKPTPELIRDKFNSATKQVHVF